MTRHEFTVTAAGMRLDRFLAQTLPQHSRAEMQRWIEAGKVTVNGRAVRVSYPVQVGDAIVAQPPPLQPTALQAEAIPLVILYEDEDLIAIDKPAGMVVHPAPGHIGGTLVNAVLHHCPELAGVGGEKRPGIVHRLDKDTSGIILVAKHDRSHRHLQAQFKARSVEKTYLALVHGVVQPPAGRIEAAVGRHPRQRQRMAVLPPGQGRPAITTYEVLTQYAAAALVAAHPHTGRTHQIRVHMAALGHPLVGDALYGPRRDPYGLGRHFLHAHRLRFRRPSDDAPLDLLSPLPAELEKVLGSIQ